MKIKKIIKKYDLTLTELSKHLNLSRPTLNNYIKLYEENLKIPNDTYNELFIKIFNKEYETRDSFLNQINSSIILGDKEINKKASTLAYSNENMNLIKRIKNKMEEDLRGENVDNSLYKFFNSALTMYGKNAPLTSYIRYFLYLNGLRDLSKVKNNEKILISHLYPLMRQFTDIEEKMELNEEGFNLFKERIEEIEKEREIRKQELTEKLNEKIELEIKNQLANGVALDKLNIKDIIENLKIKN